jgi:hypothetical protein
MIEKGDHTEKDLHRRRIFSGNTSRTNYRRVVLRDSVKLLERGDVIKVRAERHEFRERPRTIVGHIQLKKLNM